MIPAGIDIIGIYLYADSGEEVKRSEEYLNNILKAMVNKFEFILGGRDLIVLEQIKGK